MKAVLLAILLAQVTLLTSACAGSSAANLPTPTPFVFPTPSAPAMPTPSLARPAPTSGPVTVGRSIAEVRAAAPTSKYLDGLHLAKGVSCESCHGQLLASGAVTVPDAAKCFTCHTSFAALAAKTARLEAQNPHKSHQGELSCDKCHHVHRAFTYFCNNCHNAPVPERYAAR